MLTNGEMNVFARWVPAVTITVDRTGTTTPAPLTRQVALGYSMAQVNWIWGQTIDHAQTGRNLTLGGSAIDLPPYSFTNCRGLAGSSGPLFGWAPQPQGIFSTLPNNQGTGFSVNTVVDEAWLLANGDATNRIATVHAVRAPVVTFDSNHNFFVPGAVDSRVARQLTCGNSFAESNLPNLLPTPTPSQQVVGNATVYWSPEWPTIANWTHTTPPGASLYLQGWALFGWNTQRDGDGFWVDINTPITTHEGTVLFAQWRQGLSFQCAVSPPGTILPENAFREVPHPPAPCMLIGLRIRLGI